MARYRTRRPQETMHQAVLPLLELRYSPEYHEGGQAMAEQASIVAFDSEVALHALGGARSVPRRVRHQLYVAAQAELTAALEQ